MDRLNSQQHRANMAAIHSKDTMPEMVMRRYLRGHGLRSQLNPNRSLEKVSCHFLMTAIRKIALYMLDS